ncbi:ABC transporter ATP-binding protein [Flavobacterium xueshanense]|uniref:Lipopolysaccharide transport system ATP-binding protein n=1 Tax=Flavobacterium xueshanense TaxID=935223 RepID=A0A1I2GEX0_9FLAO|nr:ABC transporter ATP-binding protein [Flavobacterium xueshanense]SFF15457.1 lipopolysaccharide transport system ATP-binding protein [Flavobacterium xueshanense]
MKDIILKAENISKQYRLGQVGTGTMAHDLNRWWHQIRGKENPYLKIGDINDRSTKGESDYVWALQDINFEVERGEILGIIGKNGAGKSTLLKILSRVTAPTTGSIKFGGRVASLLEVGTGFNGEMTGRENIYLNGAILGMTKKEITSKIDEIIEFSGCERYIDTPVKRYSSGMYVRLAFAVAAFLEPEILIVDEVLAVGDAEFQKKAIGKMQDISQYGGRTVLFVSHNMAAIKQLCTKTIIMENGMIVFEGKTDDGIDYYLQSNQYEGYIGHYVNEAIQESGIVSLALVDNNNVIRTEFGFDETVVIKIKIKVSEKHLNAHLGFRVVDRNERVIFTSEIKFAEKNVNNGINDFEVQLPTKFLAPNAFRLTFGLHIPNQELIDYLEECLSFEIVETGSEFYMYNGNDYGCVFVHCNWVLR